MEDNKIDDNKIEDNKIEDNNSVSEQSDEEYIVFNIKKNDGTVAEMAVIDEFNFEHKNYVVSALIENDVINEEGYYIYRLKLKEEGFDVERIQDPKEYERIANAYLEA